MHAKDIMTTTVATVGPEARVEEIAELLLQRRISGVPVVSVGGELLGIVSEGDLMQHAESGAERHRSWWLSLLARAEEQARDYIKSHSHLARDVMTRDVVTVNEHTSIGDVARLLEQHRIKRVPVLDDGKIVGIISRANLLHGLAAQKDRAPRAASEDDRTIRETILSTLMTESWYSHGTVNVIVSDGKVELWGFVGSEQERRAIKVGVESVPGVREIEDHLGMVPPYMRST